MTKVHVTQGPESTAKRRVVWNRPMAALSFVIALNIISMPLRAYLTETLPWMGTTQSTEWNGTTYAANSTWMVLQRMQALYNDATLPANATIFKDSANYTTVMRRVMQFEEGTSCDDVLHQFPGAIFFGLGMRNAVCAYLQSSASSSAAETGLAHCQHLRNIGWTITEQCVWATPRQGTRRVVYQTLYQWEVVWFLWLKLVLRCVLTGYVIWEMRSQYYSHCLVLSRILEVCGIPDAKSPIQRIEVYIGDPTCLVLGNPVVSLCFVVDFWMSVTSVGEVILQLSQLDDVGQFATGCIYASRTVWFAYFSMRYMTYPIKRLRVSRWVVPLDPTAIAVGALLLAGPFVHLCSTTRLMRLQHALWPIGVPAEDVVDSIEIFPAILALTTMIGLVPVLLVVVIKGTRFVYTAANPPPSTKKPKRTVARIRRYSSTEFNDLNQRLMLAIVLPGSKVIRSRGGSAYVLYDLNSMFQAMPLFSHRSADCFVVGYDAANSPVEHLRLSLLRCVDLSQDGRTIALCRTSHATAMCELNTTPCPTSSSRATLRIHPGINKSPWLL